jgi:hypothetical protein
MQSELRLRGLENGERSRGATEVKQAPAVGRDVLVVAGAGAKEVAELVMAAAEPLRRDETLEPPHTSRAPFHAAVVLFEPIVMGWPAPLPCRVGWQGDRGEGAGLMQIAVLGIDLGKNSLCGRPR